jgi:hypothetical protein
MKTKHTFISLITVFAIILITSCTKEAAQKTTPPPPPPDSMFLDADHWQQLSQGGYMNDFQGIIPDSNHADVYIVTTGKEILISAGRIVYMNGEVWSAQSGCDVAVYYRDNQELSAPCGYLKIKVVF